jgi:hypothetical protein
MDAGEGLGVPYSCDFGALTVAQWLLRNAD